MKRAIAVGREPLFGYLLVVGIIENDGNFFAFDRMGILPMVGVGNAFEIECLSGSVKPPVGEKR